MDGPESNGGEFRARIADRLRRLLAELKTDEVELSKLPDASGGIDFASGRVAVKATIDAVRNLSAAVEEGGKSESGPPRNMKGDEK